MKSLNFILSIIGFILLIIKLISSSGVFLEEYHLCREKCEIRYTNNNFLTLTITASFLQSHEFLECQNACFQKNNSYLQNLCDNPSFAQEPSIETNKQLDYLKKRCQYFSNSISKIDLHYIETLYRYKELVPLDCTKMLCFFHKM